MVNENTQFDNVSIGSTIQSDNYSPGVSGFKIDGAGGSAEFTDIKVTGSGIYVPGYTNPLFHVDGDGNATVSSLKRNDFQWLTLFESIDGYDDGVSGSASVVVQSSGVQLYTGATSASEAQLQKSLGGTSSKWAWSKKRSVETSVGFSDTTSLKGYIISGAASFASPGQRHIGWYFENGFIYPSIGDGTTETLGNATVFSGTFFPYVLKWISDGTGVSFYINDVLVQKMITGLPAGTIASIYPIYVNIKNSTAADRSIQVAYWDFWQEGA
jgi:hypothetical protein